MEKFNMKVDILPNYFLKKNGTFDKESAMTLSGNIAGVCYDKEGFNHLKDEPSDRTYRRIDRTLNNGHHSVYDHINISFNIQNIPKILAMVLNNEHQYTTSEKSARYTKIVKTDNSIITDQEVELYNKWLDIFKEKIKEQYGQVHSDYKIDKLAQENARYLVTVFMPTQMIYTTTLRQINYIASWMIDYIKTNRNSQDIFTKNLVIAMQEFISKLNDLNVLEWGLMWNDKSCKLSLFGKKLDKKQEYFGDVYSTIYEGTFAYLAQAHRHRTLDYQMEMLNEDKFFVPPIILADKLLVDDWLNDMNKVKDITPQGKMIRISEMGKYEDFILKCKERLCSAAQLEIMQQTKQTLEKYRTALENSHNPLASDIQKYCLGARCTFPDFKCMEDCHFKEGKTLVRKI